ncbi:zinc finger and BTB domain-containing protein 41-like isoform X4 [Aricia agestis]|uniref:zinc finger and BTB domain-containing protein 41-like isoform X4 n=1 Tax=Aricia agestis TaxID=91739 RepID=UPI001C204741|nr:zinc finger and BTB domain-containing protein 41-like isoform X4 [Aricia agestis]
MEPKTIEWRPGPAVCRCCLAEGCYKDISTEYFWMGKREVYAEMLSETLDLSIAYSTSGGPNSNSRLICEQCISKLRDATEFKRQVQECERTFIQWLDPGNSVADATATEVKLEQVKKEKNHNSDEDDDFNDQPDFGDDDGYDDLDDDVPLTKYASKTPKKEPVDLQDLLDNVKPTTKRKSTTTKDKSTAKKAKVSKEKATSSKPKPEKKKKGSIVDHELQDFRPKTSVENAKKYDIDAVMAKKRNAAILLEYTRLCPFKWKINKYICLYCDQKFTDPELLRHHNIMNHDGLSYLNIWDALCKLKKHELVKVDITDSVCKVCSKHIHFYTIRNHLNMEHNKNLDLGLNGDMLPFKVTKDTYNCALCDEKYDDFKTLNHHMNFHFQNFICEQCGTGFITPDRLRTHSFSHEAGTFACEMCDKVFRSMNYKNEHIATVHNQVKRHCCIHCPETFKNYFQRNKHMLIVHNVKLKEFKCSMCIKVFTLSGKLKKHIRTVHLKEKRYACDKCEWKFYSTSELKEHMIKHGGERKFQCMVCKKSYARKYTLREHMRIHENDRRFICSFCGGSFIQKQTLKQHVKIHHQSESIDII